MASNPSSFNRLHYFTQALFAADLSLINHFRPNNMDPFKSNIESDITTI